MTVTKGGFLQMASRKPSYWNSVETDPEWLNFSIRNFFAIIMRFSFTLRTLVQYFLVLGNSIFLHFRPIFNKFIKVVSLRFAMCIKSSIY
ncbi:hypothetical protein T12_14808 [Trichinella patagoniensis]|uniref:Uncharacterized protein n=1 Tax=Trichinella patagoniensis TaxID=990121 RepID=A0A0V0ZMW6_9BILA|nr:hypothetical protein T12_14808 [Trichinella patagoniensis]